MSEAITHTDPMNSLISEAITAGRTVHIRAQGGSMRPLIPDGSVVELVPMTGPIMVGDVVAAQRADRLYIHRVISVGEHVELMGDSCHTTDPPFGLDQILGRIQKVTTPGGWQMRLDTPAASVLGAVTAWVSRFRT